MKVLVTIAHPDPNSFNQAILEKFTGGLAEAGHTVVINDLYADYFDPVLNRSELMAGEAGLPEDVLAQQERVTEAEALAFIHPVWWYGFPAMLKGWVDRVLTVNFAYKFQKEGPSGLLTHNKALFLRTTMGKEDRYARMGVLEALDKHITTILRGVCGIQEVAATTFYAVPMSEELRKEYLERAYRLGLEF